MHGRGAHEPLLETYAVVGRAADLCLVARGIHGVPLLWSDPVLGLGDGACVAAEPEAVHASHA